MNLRQRAASCVMAILISATLFPAIASPQLLKPLTEPKSDVAPTPSQNHLSFKAPARIEIAPAKNVDERLFLLRVLETMYEAWPVDVQDPRVLANDVAELKINAARFRQHAESSGMEPEIVKLFAGFTETLDAYANFLLNIDRIEQEALERSSQDGLASGLKGGIAGGSMYAAMQGRDYSTADSAAAAVIVGGLEYMADAWQKSSERDAAKQRAVAAAMQDVSNKITSSLTQAQNVARSMTSRRGWSRSEAGWDLSDATSEAVTRASETGDLDTLRQIVQQQVLLRPRDPFIRLARNSLAAFDENSTSASLLASAQDSVRTAALVPESPVYDEIRVQCLATAGYAALLARGKEIGSGLSPIGSTEASKYGVLLWRQVLDMEPSDTTGEIRYFLATALLSDNKVAEAAQTASSVFHLLKDDSDFNYLLACVMSRSGDDARSLAFLKESIRLGFYDIAHIKTDPDLANLRKQRQKEFADATTPKWTWNIIWGVFNDDITITNQSQFPLTGVVVNVFLLQDATVWRRKLDVELVMPGETHTWPNVVSVPGARLTASTATLTCDQSK